MKISKKDLINHVGGSPKAYAETAKKLGYELQTVYNWPQQIGVQAFKMISIRMKAARIKIPAEWIPEKTKG